MANPTCRNCDRSADVGAYCGSCAGEIMAFKAQTGEDGDTGGTKWMALAEKTLQEHARREAKV